MAKKILVTSEKSNIGKTLLCIKLALALKEKRKRTVIVELSKKTKSIAEYMDFEEQIIYDLKDVIDGECDIDKAVVEINEYIDVFPIPRAEGKLDKIDKNNFHTFISNLDELYDCIIIEVSGLKKTLSPAINESDAAIIINNNEISAISEINFDISAVGENFIRDRFVLINRFDKKSASKNEALNKKDFKKIFDDNTLYFVSEDIEYQNLTKDDKKSDLNSAISDILQKINL